MNRFKLGDRRALTLIRNKIVHTDHSLSKRAGGGAWFFVSPLSCLIIDRLIAAGYLNSSSD